MMNKRFNILYVSAFAFIFVAFFVLSLPPACSLILEAVQHTMGRSLRDPGRWEEIIRHCSYIAMFLTAGTFIFSQTERGRKFAVCIRDEFHPFLGFMRTKNTLPYFFGIFAFYFLCYYKIIASDYYYEDDVWRSYTGSRSWIGYSRYVSEFLSMIFHTSVWLSDIAPLTHFITLLFMTFSTFVLYYSLYSKEIKISALLCCTFLFLSPYFAQPFLYRFDSPYMALSVLFAIFPFLFTENLKTFGFVSFVSLILCSMSYQSALGMYILLTVFFVLRKWFSKKTPQEIFAFIVTAILSFVFAMLLFAAFFMNTIENTADSYVSSEIRLSAVPSNIIKYLGTTFSLFGGIWMKVFFVLLGIAAFVLVVVGSKRNKLASLFLLLFAGAFSYVFSFGPYLVFERPLFAPRALISFNMFVTLLAVGFYKAIFVASCNSKCARLLKTLPFFLLYGCAVFLFAYGTALSEQKEYQNFRTTLLISELQTIIPENEDIHICVSGDIGFCEGAKVNAENFPYISKTIGALPSSHYWTENLLNSYNLDFIWEEKPDETKNWSLVSDGYYQRIYASENHIWIDMKNL